MKKPLYDVIQSHLVGHVPILGNHHSIHFLITVNLNIETCWPSKTTKRGKPFPLHLFSLVYTFHSFILLHRKVSLCFHLEIFPKPQPIKPFSSKNLKLSTINFLPLWRVILIVLRNLHRTKTAKIFISISTWKWLVC